MSALFLNQLGVVCALGHDHHIISSALFASDGAQGLATTDKLTPGRCLSLGFVQDPLPAMDDVPLALRGRNNALLRLALAPIRTAVDEAIARYGKQRIAVILGTSTSGVGESERAHASFQKNGFWPLSFHYAQQEMGTPASFVAKELGVTGPAWVISTACSSSAKALASAARLLNANLADAVIVGGADSLCAFTIAGFSALGSVSAARCNPFSPNRNGINIGEGAALFLMTREPSAIRLAGWGESSDAHHMSAPDPTGRGPEAAITQALQRAGVTANDIGYVNLHGTATVHNDAMEAHLMQRVFSEPTLMSSTKPMTGHTLGAAGAIEAALCWLTMMDTQQRRLPAHWWDGQQDSALPKLNFVAPGATAAAPLRYVLSQSFAFGGSNAAVVLAAE